jgi:hypothetical protein
MQKSLQFISSTKDQIHQALALAYHHVLLLAAGTNPWDGITPNSTAIPGTSQAQSIAGGIMFYAGIMLDVGAVLGIIFLVISSRSSHMKSANEGHRWLGAAIVGAILLGSVTTFLGWGYGVGQTIS